MKIRNITIMLLLANCILLTPCMAQTNPNDLDNRLIDKKADYVALNFMNALIALNYRDAELYLSTKLANDSGWNEVVKYCQTGEGRDCDIKKLRKYRFIDNLKLEIFYKELYQDSNGETILLIWMNNYDSQWIGHDSGRVYLIEEDGQWKVAGYNF